MNEFLINEVVNARTDLKLLRVQFRECNKQLAFAKKALIGLGIFMALSNKKKNDEIAAIKKKLAEFEAKD